MKMRIMIGYDGSESADAALDDLQKAGLPREVQALIVSVGEVMMPPSSSMADVAGAAMTSRRVASSIAQAEAQAAQALKDAKEFAAKAGERVRSYFPDWEVQAEGIAGWPSTELINKADEWKADLVVVGSQGRSALGRFILGSVSKKVVTDSHHSVRVARGAVGKNDGRPPRVMIGVDGSSEAENAVRAVGMRVWPEGTEIRIIAVDDGTSPARISRLLPIAAEMIMSSNEAVSAAAHMMVEWAENELRAIGLQVSTAIEKGDPQRVLTEEARKWDADSIFVGGASSAALLKGSGSVVFRPRWSRRRIIRSRSCVARLANYFGCGWKRSAQLATSKSAALEVIPKPRNAHKNRAKWWFRDSS